MRHDNPTTVQWRMWGPRSGIVLAMRHDNPTTVQWRMWGRWWAPRLNSFLAMTVLYLSHLLSRLCDGQWSICCWFCSDGNVYYSAATHAPVLDHPAPLRRFHDSGARYKYPDLLTYLTERGCQCWRCNCIVDWLELANQSAISYVTQCFGCCGHFTFILTGYGTFE